MNLSVRRQTAFAAAILGLIVLIPADASSQAAKPTAKDKCPVCGMFVAQYPAFLAEVVFEDGFRAYFDGPKDMFRYYFEPEKYTPGKKTAGIAAVYVTDYYSLESIDGRQSFYISGSDVMGPMGNELVPVLLETQAKTFMADHKGKTILRFNEVTLEIVNSLD
jgi:nitrous oxide reductase accessory protein NosL